MGRFIDNPQEVVAKLIELAMAIECGDSNLSDSVFSEIFNAWVVKGSYTGKERKIVGWFCQAIFAKFHKIPHISANLYKMLFERLYKDITIAAIEKTIGTTADHLNKQLHLVIISPFRFTHNLDHHQFLHIAKLTWITPDDDEEEDQNQISSESEGNYCKFHVTKLVANNAGDIVQCIERIERSSSEVAIAVLWIHKLNTLLQQPGVFEQAMSRVNSLNPAVMVVFETDQLDPINSYTVAKSLNHFLYPSRKDTVLSERDTQRQIENVQAEFNVNRHEKSVKWRRLLDGPGFYQVPLMKHELISYSHRIFLCEDYDRGILDNEFHILISAWRPRLSRLEQNIVPIFNGAIGDHHKISTTLMRKKWSKEDASEVADDGEKQINSNRKTKIRSEVFDKVEENGKVLAKRKIKPEVDEAYKKKLQEGSSKTSPPVDQYFEVVTSKKKVEIFVRESFKEAIVQAIKELTEAPSHVANPPSEIWKLISDLGIDGEDRRKIYIFLYRNPDMLSMVLGCPDPLEQKEILKQLIS